MTVRFNSIVEPKHEFADGCDDGETRAKGRGGKADGIGSGHGRELQEAREASEGDADLMPLKRQGEKKVNLSRATCNCSAVVGTFR